MKTICLDYDGSYTEFPELFNMIISKAQEMGHKVILATMRYPEEIDDQLKYIRDTYNVPLYFTCRRAKLQHLADLHIYPNLWVTFSY